MAGPARCGAVQKTTPCTLLAAAWDRTRRVGEGEALWIRPAMLILGALFRRRTVSVRASSRQTAPVHCRPATQPRSSPALLISLGECPSVTWCCIPPSTPGLDATRTSPVSRAYSYVAQNEGIEDKFQIPMFKISFDFYSRTEGTRSRDRSGKKNTPFLNYSVLFLLSAFQRFLNRCKAPTKMIVLAFALFVIQSDFVHNTIRIRL